MINSLAKLYDMILCSRLKQWYKPCREQDGAQEKRGCLEHIKSLQLLCDTARRHVLFRVLRRLGCGAVMLSALVAIYTVTESVIGTAVVLISLGVGQGSPTSCLLFVIMVDDLIRIIKEGCGYDGFLRWLHILVLIYDTVLLSTSRVNMLRKLKLLGEYCHDYGMKSKTKFFVINGSETDSEPLVVDDIGVEHCNL